MNSTLENDKRELTEAYLDDKKSKEVENEISKVTEDIAKEILTQISCVELDNAVGNVCIAIDRKWMNFLRDRKAREDSKLLAEQLDSITSTFKVLEDLFRLYRIDEIKNRSKSTQSIKTPDDPSGDHQTLASKFESLI